MGPGNCLVGRLFGDPRFAEAVLKFLADTGVGKIKKGVTVRGRRSSRVLILGGRFYYFSRCQFLLFNDLLAG